MSQGLTQVKADFRIAVDEKKRSNEKLHFDKLITNHLFKNTLELPILSIGTKQGPCLIVGAVVVVLATC